MKTPRTLKQLKNDPRVQQVDYETEGQDNGCPAYWVYLKMGFCCEPATHVIHEDSIKEVLDVMSAVTPCGCAECLGATK